MSKEDVKQKVVVAKKKEKKAVKPEDLTIDAFRHVRYSFKTAFLVGLCTTKHPFKYGPLNCDYFGFPTQSIRIAIPLEVKLEFRQATVSIESPSRLFLKHCPHN